MQQSLNPRAWKNILDTLSAKVAKLSMIKPIWNVSEVSQSNCYTCDGHFLDRGVRTSNGINFIGSYPDIKLSSDSVKPHWGEIRNARGNDGNHVSRKNQNMREKIKSERRKLVKIIYQVEQLEVKHEVAQISVLRGDDGTSITAASISRRVLSTVTTSTYRSGLAFGVKNAKKRKK